MYKSARGRKQLGGTMTLEEMITRYKEISTSSEFATSKKDIKILEYFNMTSETERRRKRKDDMQL